MQFRWRTRWRACRSWCTRCLRRWTISTTMTTTSASISMTTRLMEESWFHHSLQTMDRVAPRWTTVRVHGRRPCTVWQRNSRPSVAVDPVHEILPTSVLASLRRMESQPRQSPNAPWASLVDRSLIRGRSAARVVAEAAPTFHPPVPGRYECDTKRPRTASTVVWRWSVARTRPRQRTFS